MTATSRVGAGVLLALLIPGVVLGAKDPPPASAPVPLIGGTLSAGVESVSLTSTATVAVSVAFVPDGPFTLDPPGGQLEPGATLVARVQGSPTGRVRAELHQVSPVRSGDVAGVVLEVGMPKGAPPPGVPWSLFASGLALLVGLAVLARWARPWELRLSRADGQGLAEYALILGLIAVVAILALLFLGGQVSKLLSTVGNSV